MLIINIAVATKSHVLAWKTDCINRALILIFFFHFDVFESWVFNPVVF